MAVLQTKQHKVMEKAMLVVEASRETQQVSVKYRRAATAHMVDSALTSLKYDMLYFILGADFEETYLLPISRVLKSN